MSMAASGTLGHHVPPDAVAPHAQSSSAGALPELRSDICLLPADQTNHTTPVWTLHDPVRNRFYRIGWMEFELLSRWALGTPAALLDAVNRETSLHARPAHLQALLTLLDDNELVLADTSEALDRLHRHRQRPAVPFWQRCFSFSMFYRKPLYNPDRLLASTVEWLAPLRRRRSMLISLAVLCTLMASWGAITHRYELRDTFSAYMSADGFALFVMVLIATNVLHEFGHGLMARHYGCRVPVIGVALIFLLPVAYCDTSDAWRLSDRRQRLMINAGGLLMEAALAVVALLAWIALPDGILRTLAFFLAVTSLLTTLLVNLNPFMKFDGYYLLADALNIDNLQQRSFATLRWQLRVWLSGSAERRPVEVGRRKHRIMLAYAAATWLYRLLLCLAIAAMIYHVWFKTLGVLLMLGVCLTMVVKPCLRELREHVRLIRAHGLNRRSLLTLMTLCLLTLVLVLPLPRKVSAPAVLGAASTARIMTPRPALLGHLVVAEGETVARGDLIARLDDPDLQWRETALRAEIDTLELRLHREQERVDGDPTLTVDRVAIDSKREALEEILNDQARLVLRAPADGQVVRIERRYPVGSWVPVNHVIAEIASTGVVEARAYVPAAESGHLAGDEPAIFTDGQIEVPLALQSMSRDALAELPDTTLAVIHGGTIATRQADDGASAPLQSWHLASLDSFGPLSIARERTGHVRFAARPRSLLRSLADRIYGTLLRESGF